MIFVCANDDVKRDEALAKESNEFDLAKATHDARLTAWAFNNKEKRNVRTLLSTMHVSMLLRYV